MFRKSGSKDGGIIYLVEELSDARMRAEQLSRLLDRARSVVESSDEKEHIYEVAGGLITEIPEVMFKMLQAIRAAAYSASKLDYEVLKSQILPEKSQELDEVLSDVRVKTKTVNTTKMASHLRALAALLDQQPEDRKIPAQVVGSLWDLVGEVDMYGPAYPSSVRSKKASSNKGNGRILISAVRSLLAGDRKEGFLGLSAFFASEGKDNLASLLYEESEKLLCRRGSLENPYLPEKGDLCRMVSVLPFKPTPSRRTISGRYIRMILLFTE